MTNKTVNYGLIKPLATEYYDVNIQNGNMDVIYREIKNINDISNKKISELDSKINDMKVSEFKTDVLKKFENVESSLADMTKHSTYKLNKDNNDIYTEIQIKRQNGTLIMKSVLSGGISPKYSTRRITEYGSDGTTILSTSTFTLAYDASDSLISEVLA